MALSKLFVEWLDVSLNYLRSANYVSRPAAVAAYLAALQGASNAGEIITTEGTPAFPNNPGVNAQYPSAFDTAVCQFKTGPGSTVVVTIPAPVLALFTSDAQTVDPSDPTGVLAAAIAALSDTLGNDVVSFHQGVRAQRRKDIA